jgi:putative ABC transport system substrate-binding protein
VRRREFITLLGGAAVWPVAAHAQQVMPVIGLLSPLSAETESNRLRAFRQGLKETGHVEGENLTIKHRWAENQMDRLPQLAAELVGQRVAVLVAAGTTAAALAAKAATTTTPVLFVAADDPVRLGLVESLARPGGNVTGVNFFSAELVAKRLELLRELIPGAARLAVLVNPANPTSTESTLKDVSEAAPSMGLQAQIFKGNTGREIDEAFAAMVHARSEALLVSPDPYLSSRSAQFVVLTARHGIPAIFTRRDLAEAGGLMSYGASLTNAYRQLGIYAGRILKGAKPADLPVVQSTKFELVINLVTARALGLTVSPTLLARADEVIE